MRLIAVFLLLSGSLAAEIGFLTGQAARLVIGQRTFTSQTPGASKRLLGGVGGVAYADDMLFVADSNRLNASPQNHRVLIYKNISQKWPGPLDEIPQDSRCPVCVGEADVVLGQKEFDSDEEVVPPGPDTLRRPLGVASDGIRLAVADTDNNRVLIWNSIPAVNGQPADIVLGQKDFTSNESNGNNPRQDSLRGPQGVWWQDGALWVADTGNNRVLMWRNPTRSGQPADLVLGAPDFTTFVQPDITQENPKASAKRLLVPTSVTSDGQRLYVTDLGHNRVLIWNSIPTQNGQPADVVIGQPDMEARLGNNSQGVCEPTGEDEEGNPTYPRRCAATLDFPRFAISDGEKLFIADGGNDRILVFNEIPTENGARADVIIGQITEFVNNTSDGAFPDDVAAAGTVRTPTSLAWDGLNLYVTDPFNRRVLVFTMAENRVAYTGLRNAASFEVFAVGRVTFDGEPAKDDEVTLTIQEGVVSEEERAYTYKVKEDDTITDIVNGLSQIINDANDPDVLAVPNAPFSSIILTAKIAGEIGNEIKYKASASQDSKIIVDTAGPKLKGGEEASKIAPYSIVTIVGQNLADETVAADLTKEELPRELGGVQVYIDGIRAPLYYVSPTQINAQMPVEVFDTKNVSAYVRTVHRDGRVVASNAIPVPIIQFNPGIFAREGVDPRPAVAFHSSSKAMGVISVDGTAKAGDKATVIIEGRRYTYEITQEDEDAGECPEDQETCREKLDIQQRRVRDALIEMINSQDPRVEAVPSTQFARIRLFARVEGPEGNGIPYSTEVNDGANIILTPTTTELCCANRAGAPVTEANPALPGEVIYVWATGLGLITPKREREFQITGAKFRGTGLHKPVEFVSSLAGGRTANVLHCGIEPGTFGLYRCDLQLNQGLPTNPLTPLTIAQGFQVSNIVTIPVFDPTPEER